MVLEVRLSEYQLVTGNLIAYRGVPNGGFYISNLSPLLGTVGGLLPRRSIMFPSTPFSQAAHWVI